MSPSTRHGPARPRVTRDLPPPPGVTLVEGGAEVAVYAGHSDGAEICLFEAGNGIDVPRAVLEDGQEGGRRHEHINDDGCCAGEPLRRYFLPRHQNPEPLQEIANLRLVRKPAPFYRNVNSGTFGS